MNHMHVRWVCWVKYYFIGIVWGHIYRNRIMVELLLCWIHTKLIQIIPITIIRTTTAPTGQQETIHTNCFSIIIIIIIYFIL